MKLGEAWRKARSNLMWLFPDRETSWKGPYLWGILVSSIVNLFLYLMWQTAICIPNFIALTIAIAPNVIIAHFLWRMKSKRSQMFLKGYAIIMVAFLIYFFPAVIRAIFQARRGMC